MTRLQERSGMNQVDMASFEVKSKIPKQCASAISSTQELLLLSWLLVLLRTAQDEQVNFDWAYDHSELGSQSPITTLSESEVLLSRQGNIKLLSQSISSKIDAIAVSKYILLSTGSLTRPADPDANQGNLIHIEASINDGILTIRPVWSSVNVLPFTLNHVINSLVYMVNNCILRPDASVEELVRTGHHDLDAIWGWNHQLPPSHPFCMHEMVAERARQYPEKEAIHSWDGSLNYGQIETYSTRLALSLIKRHPNIPRFIPICFEKSKWTIVAVLAVMKLGAAMVLMDPTLPLARLQNMRDQVGAILMITSRTQSQLSASILPDGEIVVVDEQEIAKLLDFSDASSNQTTPELPTVSPSALMYIIFTSGSTGAPKGVMISHRAYTSSAIPRAAAVGYKENTRVLDFASYAFDVSIDSMLLTLGNGGCLCIPSDEDRVNDINGVMKRMRVSYAGITPSMARLLEPDVITQLSALGLGGEAASSRDVNRWGQDTRIIIGYGPCECTIGCTINSDTATGRDYISIGVGNGAAIWIVDPNDHESLLPVGAVGELLVEGPIVGQGYFNDGEKTKASFIHDPEWLVAGHEGYHGRRGVLYKTGDLGMYDPDGSGGIIFVGRKDTQVKLRGQRIELGEIESQLRTALPSGLEVVAEVIKPINSGSQPTLVAFVAQKNSDKSSDLKLASYDKELDARLTDANADLIKVLPRYMVPAAYVPVSHVPLLISGKVDRKKIREFGSNVDLRQQLGCDISKEADSKELSDVEERLRRAWGQTLKMDIYGIGRQANFFALGGDSLAAMRLVSVCRDHGLNITVSDIFGNPTLGTMATSATIAVDHLGSKKLLMETESFSLISQDIDSARQQAAQACNTSPTVVQDIYPCTPTQESLFTFSMKSSSPYIAQRIAKIPSGVDLEEWKKAWEAMVAASPILRTRVVQLQDRGLQQVVLDEAINWMHFTGLKGYLHSDKSLGMDLGQRLARYAVVNDSDDRYMVWTIHHVVYDGYSEPLLLDMVRRALKGNSVHVTTHMKEFVKYVRETNAEHLDSFWREELSGAIGPQFPALPSRDYFPVPDSTANHIISLKEWSNKSASTVATLLRGAWTLVASQHTGSDDVVFGETLMGRDIALRGVESICGPMVATVPVRVQINPSKTVSDFLDEVQQTLMRIVPYEHAGMQNIRKVSEDAQFACETGTGIVIQPESAESFVDLGFEAGDTVQEALHFNPYPLMIAFGLGKDKIRVSTSFDGSLIETSRMTRILGQLETVFLQMSQQPEQLVEQISCISAAELNQIWSQNLVAPMSFPSQATKLKAAASAVMGAKYPPAVVSWVCAARNSSLLAPIGCVGELCLEGDTLMGELSDSPSWLLAGSSKHAGRTGKVQFTGDMVQMQQDGSLIYIGRKDSILSARKNPMNLAQLQAHLDRQLPPSVSAVPIILPPSPMDAKSDGEAGRVVVFVEQQSLVEEHIELLWMKHNIRAEIPNQPPIESSICASAAVSLATALHNVRKTIRSLFPSRMSPMAYIPLERLPRDPSGQVNLDDLSRIAATIPQHILEQLRKALEEWWENGGASQDLSPAEAILQRAWSEILGRKPKEIDVQDNFFRLGGDSVLAMKLVSLLRSQGHGLTVADIFKNMRLSSAAKVLRVDLALSKDTRELYKPFSLMKVSDIDTFLSDVVQPKLSTKHLPIVDVFPVTDMQALDIRATLGSLRTSIQYTLLYFDKSVDRKRLRDTCNKWVEAHGILRTVFIQHESKMLQVVLKGDPGAFEMKTCADSNLESFIETLCKTDVERKFELGTSFLRLFYVEGDAERHCLAIGLSHAQYDGVSLPMLLQSLNMLYSGGEQEPCIPFSWYMSYTKDGSAKEKAINYWKDLLRGSAPSVLVETQKKLGGKGLFESQCAKIENLPADITTASFLAAVWAVVVARRLGKRDVTFGSVTSGRGIELPDVDKVEGPCYQFTPLRLRFEPHWTGMDLMQHVQQQCAESAGYDFLGYEEISAECTNWSESGSITNYLDSVVHHQDWEDIGMMPFGKGTCRVEIMNPHGDAPHPLKVVSFVRDEELHFGIVGQEGDAVILHQLLSQLIETAQELVQLESELISLGNAAEEPWGNKKVDRDSR